MMRILLSLLFALVIPGGLLLFVLLCLRGNRR